MSVSPDFSVFAHLNAEKALLYRAILNHFGRRKKGSILTV